MARSTDQKMTSLTQAVATSANSLLKRVKRCERISDPNFLKALAKRAKRLAKKAESLALLAEKAAESC